MSRAEQSTDNQSGVLYELLDPDRFDPQERGHEPRGGNQWFTQNEEKLDFLDEQDVINVIDWNRSADPDISFSGPFEPVSGDVEKIVYTEDGDILSTELGTWVCKQCGSTTKTAVQNGELQEPHECSMCERQGPFYHEGLQDRTVEGTQIAMRASQMWHPPTDISPDRFSKLWRDVKNYIYDHWDAGGGENAEAIYHGLTAYVISTWLRENLTFVPHLMLMGKTTGGKTRLLNTLARVSYRAMVSASATPASMFRLIDQYNVTYFVSEYHGLHPDTRREIDNVVRAGQKRNETVTRAEPTATGHEPMVFNPFSHIGVATQYKPADDIVNRCIQVQSSSPVRDMPATHDETTAENIRNRLLYARYRLLDSPEWQRAEQQAYDYLDTRNIDGRTREKLLSLLTVAHLWDTVNEFEPFVDIVVEQDREAAADSEDAKFVEVVRDLAIAESGGNIEWGETDPFRGIEIQYTDIVERYEETTGVEKTSSWVGHVCKRLGFEKNRTRNGTVISDPELGKKLRTLCEELNLPFQHIDGEAEAEKPLEPQIVTYVRKNETHGNGVPKAELIEHFVEKGEEKERVEKKIDNALQRVSGGILESSEGVYRTK